MSPQHDTSNGVVWEKDSMLFQEQNISEDNNVNCKYKMEIVWRNVFYISYFHLAALYGIYLMFTSAKLATFLFACFLFIASGAGITVGAHRLWTHRSYKASFGMRTTLMILNCMAFEDTVYEWARNHRVHHKFSETDADPHNSTRGFFLSCRMADGAKTSRSNPKRKDN